MVIYACGASYRKAKVERSQFRQPRRKKKEKKNPQYLI
jgi:hypothetical protein